MIFVDEPYKQAVAEIKKMARKDDDIVTSWVLMHKCKRNSEEFEENFWAYSELDEMTLKSPCRALDVIKNILLTDDSDEMMANLAAGPIEDLLVRHGDEVISDIEKLSMENDKFRFSLKLVWKNDISDSTWSRLVHIREGGDKHVVGSE